MWLNGVGWMVSVVWEHMGQLTLITPRPWAVTPSTHTIPAAVLSQHHPHLSPCLMIC